MRRLALERQTESEPADKARQARIGSTYLSEWRRVLADRPVFSLMVIAPLIYGVFYPQPYLGQLVRKIPIAVVDDDRTSLSRQFIQTLAADEAVSVALVAPTMNAVQQALYDRKVFGIVEIPPDTERDVFKGEAARVPAYVDSAYFLVFNRTLSGILESAIDTNLAHAAPGTGALARLALAARSPIELVLEPLYNPTGGYASYVVPAAFMLIIQQTLLMGAATLAGFAFQRRERAASPPLVLVTLVGRALAHLTIYIPALLLYLVILPRLYGFSTLGRPLDLALFAVPFILAVSLMGQAAGCFFRHRETAMLAFVATTLPQFFLVGVSWPREMIPPALDTLRRIFPSVSGIDGLVRINQMGATLAETRSDWLYLWLLAAIYLGLGVLAASRRGPGRRVSAHAV